MQRGEILFSHHREFWITKHAKERERCGFRAFCILSFPCSLRGIKFAIPDTVLSRSQLRYGVVAWTRQTVPRASASGTMTHPLCRGTACRASTVLLHAAAHPHAIGQPPGLPQRSPAAFKRASVAVALYPRGRVGPDGCRHAASPHGHAVSDPGSPAAAGRARPRP